MYDLQTKNTNKLKGVKSKMTMNGFILEYQGKLATELFVPIIQPLLPEVCKFFDGNDCVLDLFSLHLVFLLS